MSPIMACALFHPTRPEVIMVQLQRLGFPFTEEQILIREAAAGFAREHIAPGAAERDRTRAYPLELIRTLGAQGLLAMKVPIEHGGSGTDNTGYVLAMEAIAEACASVAVILASSNLVANILSKHGTADQKTRWLAPFAAGELGPAAFALTEPHTGSDARALKTTATSVNGDTYVLNGSKMWITSGAQAGLYLVFARTPTPGDEHALSAFILNRDTPGLTIGKDEHKMGLRSSGTVALHFDDCRVPADQRVGQHGRGYHAALEALGSGRVGIAAQSLGIAEAGLREGIAYASERRAFGKRVIDFQNSQFVLADCRLELDAAWLLMLRAAHLLDRGARARAESSMAKIAASEACGRVVDRCLQLHGGYGYSEEYLIERLYRDARITRIYEGTNEIQRIIIARSLMTS